MKNTYLVKKQNDNGMFVLEEVSGTQWIEIVKRNKSLPKEQKRYFISDCIEESDGIDRMYIEVSYEEYKKCQKYHFIEKSRVQKEIHHSIF